MAANITGQRRPWGNDKLGDNQEGVLGTKGFSSAIAKFMG